MKHHRSPSPDAPRKRRQLLPPSSAPADSSPVRPRVVNNGLFPLPAPHLPRYGAHPVDSPSNPFGRRLTWKSIQDLPRSTSFAKHFALRFQYVRRGVRNQEPTDGVYRIVQVPKNYTLVHVRCLLWWLFGGMLGVAPPDPKETHAHHNPSIYSPTRPGEEAPYQFELKKDILLYKSLARPGTIKSGTTWAVASAVLDPYLYTPDREQDDDDDEDDEERVQKERELEEEAEEQADGDHRRWMAEEDVTLAHVWPEGPDKARGLVYTHNRQLQIHITYNTMKLPHREGRGREPYVFRAVGNTYLDPPYTAPEDVPSEDEDAEFDDTDIWNASDAFAEYYNKNTILPLTSFELQNACDSDDEHANPGVTHSSSPASSSSIPTPRSRRRHSSPARIARGNGSDPFLSSPLRSALRAPKYTPAPKPKQRKRLMHLQRQLGKLTKAKLAEEQEERDEERREEKRKRQRAKLARSLEMAMSEDAQPSMSPEW